MVVQQEVQKLFQNLAYREAAFITVGSVEILVRSIEDGKQLVITTPIYSGGNYIPSKVRHAVALNSIQSKLIHPKLIIDEDKFEIYLRYTADKPEISLEALKEDLEEFAWLAEEWRIILDEEDRNDRVHIVI